MVSAEALAIELVGLLAVPACLNQAWDFYLRVRGLNEPDPVPDLQARLADLNVGLYEEAFEIFKKISDRPPNHRGSFWLRSPGAFQPDPVPGLQPWITTLAVNVRIIERGNRILEGEFRAAIERIFTFEGARGALTLPTPTSPPRFFFFNYPLRGAANLKLLAILSRDNMYRINKTTHFSPKMLESGVLMFWGRMMEWWSLENEKKESAFQIQGLSYSIEAKYTSKSIVDHLLPSSLSWFQFGVPSNEALHFGVESKRMAYLLIIGCAFSSQRSGNERNRNQ